MGLASARSLRRSAAALNAASRSEWVAVVDSDNMMENGYFGTLLAHWQRVAMQAVCCETLGVLLGEDAARASSGPRHTAVARDLLAGES